MFTYTWQNTQCIDRINIMGRMWDVSITFYWLDILKLNMSYSFLLMLYTCVDFGGFSAHWARWFMNRQYQENAFQNPLKL